jgi:ATP-dependent DNA helicase RecG
MALNVFNLPLTVLKGVGERNRALLAKLGLATVGDLLFHLPLRYEDRTRITPLNKVKPGDWVMIQGVLESVSVQGRGRRFLVCRVRDDSGVMTLRFFHFNATQLKNLQQENTTIRCFGEVRAGFRQQLEMTHPEYRTGESLNSLVITNQLTAIYPVTKGVSSVLLRKLMAQVWVRCENYQLPELLSSDILKQYQWGSLLATLQYVHAPPVGADIELLQQGQHPMQQRLAFEELLAHQLSMVKTRQHWKHQPTYQIEAGAPSVQKLLEALPFSLTNAQQRVWLEIQNDLSSPMPMLRLVQGDVGSGKTILAALAMCQVVDSKKQAALMAPTELLCEQHYQNFCRWLKPLGIRVTLLTAGLKAAEKKQRLAEIKSHQVDLVIGTHALFQASVEFADMALIVVDEQHRFGVQQRLSLVKKGVEGVSIPHQLTMTATPIPRTLAMSAYGDMDCSVIDELPPGRQPIKTCLLSQQKREEVIAKVQQHSLSGQQVYWVCTLVEESEVLEAQAAEQAAAELSALLPDLNIGLVHGRMKSVDKEKVMQAFVNRALHVLVATTVIEVGVDVPNATLMVIDNPERLGLAQLHQLRGRVGRGLEASYCFLLYKQPLSKTARQRLSIMRESQDGFYIAEQDLLMRGPGEVLGVRQSGLMDFKVADIIRDRALLDEIHQEAKRLVQDKSPTCALLIQRWLQHTLQYAQV